MTNFIIQKRIKHKTQINFVNNQSEVGLSDSRLIFEISL
jgi:hypothetical protein